MSILKYILLAPFAALYGLGVKLRHKLYDCKAFKSTEFDIPIVCVGNITVGGTGKTPMTELLVQALSGKYNVAVLSRGYKRQSKGFVMVETTSSFKRVGDEPKQIKLKFPNVVVAVCEDRVEGVNLIRKYKKEVNLIILDDAFQHRKIEAWVNVILMDYNRPIYEDKFLPVGRLRDSIDQMDRANIVICTKCPKNMTPFDMRVVSKNLELMPYQHLFFTKIISSEPSPLFPDFATTAPKAGSKVIAMAGIASPSGFLSYLSKKYTLVNKHIFSDHYTFKLKDIEALQAEIDASPEDTYIVMTEKDAVKLIASKRISDRLRAKMFYISISHQFVDGAQIEFERLLLQYVRENQKNNIVHPK